MFKVIRLLTRRAGLSPEAFQAEWSAKPAPPVPGLRRLVRSLPLLQGYRKGDLAFDAMSELWFDNAGAYHPVAKRIGASEGAVADAAKTVVLPVAVHVIKDGVPPEGAVKNVELVHRRKDLALDKFRDYWRGTHGPIAARIPVLRRYEQNHLDLGAYADGATPPCDGLAITWFASTADMRAGTSTPEYATTRNDEPNFIDTGNLPIVITRETVLLG